MADAHAQARVSLSRVGSTHLPHLAVQLSELLFCCKTRMFIE